MFSKSNVSQSMIDAVNKVLEQNQPEPEPVPKTPAEGGRVPWVPNVTTLTESSPIKEPTSTGMRVYGSSYGNSAKAKKDQTKSPVDNLKGPKDKEMKEAAKPDFLDMDKDGNKKESMKKAIADKGMKEELKGNQHKIDANNNNKIDAQDFKILQAKKKVKEEMSFAKKLLETVRKSDVPAYLRKAKGDTPLTVADVKGPKKDSISAPENLAKNRNEEVEHLDEDNLDSIAKKHGMELKKTTYGAGMKHPTHGEVSINRYGEWNHKGKTGDSTGNFASLDKHLSSLKEASYEPSNDPITTDTLAGRMPGGKMNSFKSYKLRVKPVSKEGETKPGDDTPAIIQPQDTPARRSHEVKEEAIEEVTIAGTPGWEKIKASDEKGNIKDKSGAVHTPMSRARDLARQAYKKIKKETMMGKISN